MPEFIVAHEGFCQRQIEALAEYQQACCEQITAFCKCSLVTSGAGCMRRNRPRTRRSRSRRRTEYGKGADPDGGLILGQLEEILNAFAPLLKVRSFVRTMRVA